MSPVPLRIRKHICISTGWVQIIGGFRYAITWVGSVSRSWNSCLLHTVNVNIWHKEVREYLNEHVPGRWVGRAAARDNTFCTWPPRSPDLTVCDFFLWDFRQGQCLRPTTSKDTTRIARAHSTPQSGTSHKDMLGRVWREWEYRLDICRWGAHRMHLRSLWNCEHSFFNGSNIMYFCSVFVKIWFCKILR